MNFFNDDENIIIINGMKVYETNPKKYTCNESEIHYVEERPIKLKDVVFTCDNCSSIMTILNGKYGLFIGCPHWQKDKLCAKNSMKLIIKKN